MNPKPNDESALLYERVADHIASSIRRGTLRPGHRLPSVRALSKQQGVSVATVLSAYLALENRGLIEARPQSGHYVRARERLVIEEPRVPRVSQMPSRVSVGPLLARVYGSSRDPHVVQLGAATVSPQLLPTEKLGRAMVAVARTAGGAGMGYDLPPGCLALRRQIARRSLSWGCALGADDFVTTVGAMEALHLCVRAVAKSGDTIAVESPAYYGLLALVESLGIRVLEIPASARSGMDLDVLEQVLGQHRVKAVLATPNFSNPLGSVMSDRDKERMVALLTRRGVPLIEDDIYGDIHFGDARPRAAKAFDREGMVMLCGSFSKTIAPGYRVGWVAPGRFRDAIEQLKFAQTVGNATLPQLAVAAFLESGGYDHHLRQLRRRLASQVERMREAIAEHFPPGTRVTNPTGGFVLWVELPPGIHAETLHERALERGVSIVPGPLFSARQRFSNCIRISCGNPWSEVQDHAVRTVGHLAAREAKPVTRAS
jgi:DNA-binding transcriptional MocR family regulator